MKKLFTTILASLLWVGATNVNAKTLVGPTDWLSPLAKHFFGSNPTCRFVRIPVLIVTDLTLNGEIDDNITVYMYRILEQLGCVKIVGVVSIHGNGGSSTAEIHRNLEKRLPILTNNAGWPLLRGPDERYTTVRNSEQETKADQDRLARIASLINEQGQPAVIAELGPTTVSARLTAGGYLSPKKIKKILGVGGRVNGESFGTDRRLGKVFAFRDMNVAEDVKAQDYLVRYHHKKLWMVTYRTGIEGREVLTEKVYKTIPVLKKHALDRLETVRSIGFAHIPSWDTWTTSYFIQDGNTNLGCEPLRAKIKYSGQGRDKTRLILSKRKGLENGHTITACVSIEE